MSEVTQSFHRQPSIAEAHQYDGSPRSRTEIAAFAGFWILPSAAGLYLKTPSGFLPVHPGDWVVRQSATDWRVETAETFANHYQATK